MAKRRGRSETIAQRHPRYDEWSPVWRLLGEVYEGDGGFMDGGHLIAHPREINFARKANGEIDYDTIVGYKQKYHRRQAVARYENFASMIVDTFVAYQFQKTISRTIADERHPITEWWQDVDGQGTPLDDWLMTAQTLAHVYGMIWVVVDRQEARPQAVTVAEQAPIVLRIYTPLDALDWVVNPNGEVTAVKFAESPPRVSLEEPVHTATDASDRIASDDIDIWYRFWTESEWRLVDRQGKLLESGVHGLGELPIVRFYSKRRARLPVVGRSLLRDPKLFKDHYNLLSELRELLRNQTFSILHVLLGEQEQPEAARQLIGDHVGTDSVMYSRQGADYLTPPAGPAETYQQELGNLERKFFRLSGLPFDVDTRDVESAEAKRLKASDLNKLLSGFADEAERAEYAIHRLWFLLMRGAEAGQRELEQQELTVKHPDEFHTEELLEVINNAMLSFRLGLGQTANRELRKRLVPIVLPDADPTLYDSINTEIETTPEQPEIPFDDEDEDDDERETA